MEDTKPENDAYLSFITGQIADFAKRETHIEQMEERVRTAREALQADRNKMTSAAQSYRDFLLAQGRDVAVLDELIGGSVPVEVGTGSGQVSSRVGAKRRKVLEALAEFTAEGLTASTAEIAEMADVDKTLVSNVVWDDRRRGNVETILDGQHRMTALGYDLLRRIGSEKGKLTPKEPKTPNDLLDRSGQ